jgi:glycosyltransferase involved in cell wall biosynthesis
MKRILHVIPTLEPGWSQRQLALICRALARRRDGVQVVVLRETEGSVIELPSGVEVLSLGAHPRWDGSAWQRWMKCVRQFDPDVIHSWTPEAYRWAWLANQFARRPRLVVSLPDDCHWEAWHWRVMESRLLSGAARVLVNCRGVAEHWARCPAVAARTTVLDSGVELPESAGMRSELLGNFGLPENSLLICAVGQLRSDRRLKDLIWAADMLKFIRGDVHLLIVGDGPHRSRLQRFTRQVRIEDKVHFLGVRADWPHWLGCIDVFWSARESAGQPLALMEAMARGLPVVASRTAGSQELIDDARDGFLVRVGDRLAIARVTQRLLENSDLRAQLGAAARRKIFERFNASAMTAGVNEIYEAVVRD